MPSPTLPYPMADDLPDHLHETAVSCQAAWLLRQAHRLSPDDDAIRGFEKQLKKHLERLRKQ
ncbi:MAG: hypothetical protein D6786_07350 [Gammaproteobacteria bacterium]|nr:MAG: hypothetical protein D6786_07350 [Gammaproteobacteria bacterium]